MTVSVVKIKVMRVGVHQRRMLMLMGVRLDTIPTAGVLMLVILVVAVHVRMGQALVPVGMIVALGDVQPYTDCHQQSRNPEQRPRAFGEQQHGRGGPEERGDRKIGLCYVWCG